jgi:squalene-hopene/tetraprenyl-beta-curcumene cyclase
MNRLAFWTPLVGLLALAAGSAAAAPFAPQETKPAAPAAAPRPLDLRTLANGAVHSLRASQGKDGSYGGSVRTTGLALYGFARMLRQYREVDGPFITKGVEYLLANRRPDGSFAGAADKDAAASSFAAALALDALDAKKYGDVVKGAVSAAAVKAGKPAPAAVAPGTLEALADDLAPGLLLPTPGDDEAARMLVSTRHDDKGGYGDPATTASKLIVINQLAARTPPPKPQEPPAVALPPYDPGKRVDVDEAIRKGVKFLASRQAPTGEFGSAMTRDQWLGVTALAAQALWAWPGEAPADVKTAAVKATEKVATAARPDGSIHGGGLENYTTSASVGALVASKDAKYKAIVDAARKYLTDLQADEGEGLSKEHWSYGGFGYGNEERPDMSNTQLALDALVAAGARSGDPAIRKALTFLERCQNRSESNSLEISRDGVLAVAGNDGGAVYYPGKSQAGSDASPDGVKQVPRSYGSMTYALLKGFVFAGLTKDDPRMKAALDWCKKNYTVDRVPGYEEMSRVSPRAAYQGLFSYYLTMATALRASGEDVLELPGGKKIDWRQDLAARLASLQKADGSWTNENSARWYEGDEVIATAYAILTLAALKK